LGRNVAHGSGRSSAQSMLQRKKHSSQLTFLLDRLPCALLATNCLQDHRVERSSIKAPSGRGRRRPLRKSQTKPAATRKQPKSSHLDVTIAASSPDFAEIGEARRARVMMRGCGFS
jgi:hypothetical protein